MSNFYIEPKIKYKANLEWSSNQGKHKTSILIQSTKCQKNKTSHIFSNNLILIQEFAKDHINRKYQYIIVVQSNKKLH